MGLRAEEAIPHDILKPAHWSKHYDTKLLPDFLRGTEVEKAIREHHEKWFSDTLAAAVGRPFFDGPDYMEGEDIDNCTLFFIPVYETDECKNGVVRWTREKRKKLQEDILRIFKEERRKGGKNWLLRANRRVNEALRHFPADTWSPVSSLKAHHMSTWMLHPHDDVLKGIVKDKISRGEYPELLMLMIGVPSTEFHKLKERRKFEQFRKSTISKIEDLFFKTLPEKYGLRLPFARVGDEVLTLILADQKVRRKPILKLILSTLMQARVKCRITVMRIPVSREKSKTRRRDCYVISEEPRTEEYPLGATLEEGKLKGKAEWVVHMKKPLVLWVVIRPKDLVECCRFFIEEYAMKKLESLPRVLRPGAIKRPEPMLAANPDLMITITDDYMRFLRDVKKVLGPKSDILMSFSESLFIRGMKEPESAVRIYARLLSLKRKLHIPVDMSLILTYNKFPFWRVLEIAKTYKNSLTFLPRGGTSMSLTEKDFEEAMKVIPIVKGIKKSVWGEVVKASAKSMTEFMFELERLTIGKGKLTIAQRNALLKLAKTIEQNHQNEPEHVRRVLRYRIFDGLSDFAGKKT